MELRWDRAGISYQREREFLFAVAKVLRLTDFEKLEKQIKKLWYWQEVLSWEEFTKLNLYDEEMRDYEWEDWDEEEWERDWRKNAKTHTLKGKAFAKFDEDERKITLEVYYSMTFYQGKRKKQKEWLVVAWFEGDRDYDEITYVAFKPNSNFLTFYHEHKYGNYEAVLDWNSYLWLCDDYSFETNNNNTLKLYEERLRSKGLAQELVKVKLGAVELLGDWLASEKHEPLYKLTGEDLYDFRRYVKDSKLDAFTQNLILKSAVEFYLFKRDYLVLRVDKYCLR